MEIWRLHYYPFTYFLQISINIGKLIPYSATFSREKRCKKHDAVKRSRRLGQGVSLHPRSSNFLETVERVSSTFSPMSTPRALYLKATFLQRGSGRCNHSSKNCRTSSKGRMLGVQGSMGTKCWSCGCDDPSSLRTGQPQRSVFEWAMVIFMPRNYTFLCPELLGLHLDEIGGPSFSRPILSHDPHEPRLSHRGVQRSNARLDKCCSPSPSLSLCSPKNF